MASLKIDESVFEKLAEVLKKHNLSEIEYAYGEAKIRISAGNSSLNTMQYQQPVFPISQQNSGANEDKIGEKQLDYSKHPGAVKSPMVGTCYLAPEPGANNFIALGDSVQAGQPLLIIEAMKVMNLIKAPKSGKVIHIAASNAEPIEFGQLLVVIE